MRIGISFPTIYASGNLFKDRIMAPRELLTDFSDELVKRGHDVVVFSSEDFKTKAKLIGVSLNAVKSKPAYYKFRNIEEQRRAWINDEFNKRSFEIQVVFESFKFAQKNKLDILHSYHDSCLFLTHYFQELVDFPTIYSLHDPLPPVGSFEYLELSRFKQHSFIALSRNMIKQSALDLNFVATVYNGIKLSDYDFGELPSDYLLFMGRLVPEKGLDIAINTALVLNSKLQIGTEFPDYSYHNNDYFNSKIKPYLGSPLIIKAGIKQGASKNELYKNAKALLFPIKWEEPFGMVMIEAMASGTPVIAYNRGSVPEVIIDGVTGFIVNDKDYQGTNSWIIKKQGVEGLVEAVQRIGEVDRSACRRHVESNFTIEKMVSDYEKLYLKLCD